MMNVMGVELFELDWVKGIVLFFSRLAWSLYITRLVIALFETVIKMQSGKGSFRDLGLNAIKGFMAVSLFSIVPIELYKLSINLQGQLSIGISGLFATPESISTLGLSIITSLVIPKAGLLLRDLAFNNKPI